MMFKDNATDVRTTLYFLAHFTTNLNCIMGIITRITQSESNKSPTDPAMSYIRVCQANDSDTARVSATRVAMNDVDETVV